MNTRGSVDRRSGQIFVLFLFVLAVVLGFAMFAVDMGHMVVTDSRLQNSVDAATLAAGQVLLEQYVAGADETEARAAADAEATLIQALNPSGGWVEIVYGTHTEEGAFVAVDTGQHATAVRGLAHRDDDAPAGPCGLFFAPTIGINDVDLQCTALIQIESQINAIYRGLSPFAIPEDAVPAIGQELIFYPGSPSDPTSSLGQDKYVGGNWGLLDLSQSGGAPGNSQLADWILNGYDEGITIPEGGMWIDGAPGLHAALKTPMEAKIGQQMIMVVFDEVLPAGANAQYHATGFVVVTRTAVKLTGNNKALRARVDQLTNISDVGTGSGGWSGTNIRKIQLTQ